MITLQRLGRQARRAVSVLGLKPGRLRAPRGKWESEAQTYEFRFHKENLFRQTDAFAAETFELLTGFGFTRDQFAGKVVLDIGAGSRLRTKFFEGCKLVALEPLAERFMRELPWCDLNDAAAVYSRPAEEWIPELKASIDFICSINVLDHCFDFEAICRNIHSYLKSDGSAFLSFDSHSESRVGHPLVLEAQSCKAVFRRVNLVVAKELYGFPAAVRRRRGRDGYDGSSTCLSYWLEKG